MIDVPENNGAYAEMPKYVSHKEVWALKLDDVEFNEEQDKYAIKPSEGQGIAPIFVEKEWGERYKGTDDDKGYYVVYKDGYKSWSPTKAFEEGYTKL